MHIGLFFGTFNPVHVGHLIIANHMAEETEMEQVWFVVSPQNPFKKRDNLLPEYDRLHMVQAAIEENDRLQACDIEFRLPKPSYTINTLVYLKEKYPQHTFSLIMGGDNLQTLPKWKHGDIIARDYSIFVYQRPGHMISEPAGKNIHILEVPLMHISSSFIRKRLKEGKSVTYLLPAVVEKIIEQSGWYK